MHFVWGWMHLEKMMHLVYNEKIVFVGIVKIIDLQEEIVFIGLWYLLRYLRFAIFLKF